MHFRRSGINKMRSLSPVLLAAVAVLSGCMTAAQHQASVRGDEAGLTLGVAQKEIRVGMSGAEVAEKLGSPNIVTTGGDGNETWIYDKIATEASYSRSSAGIGILILFTGALRAGAPAGAVASSGASSESQRTLTVVVKFDGANRVRDLAYHASRF